MPQVLPEPRRLRLAAYFRPLVNVSGDYYTALPIDDHKTLLMLGDVSGKGLPAALIMGLVMNTVKIMENKEDLVSIVYAVDKAIKGMKLQDKYTVLFISVVDTQKMTIRYVNASMSDPRIITRSPDGYTIPRGLKVTDELVAEFQRIHDAFGAIMADYEHKPAPKPKSANQVRAWLEKITNPDTCPDSPRYKACGNGWATNQPRWILTRLLAIGEHIDPFTGEEDAPCS